MSKNRALPFAAITFVMIVWGLSFLSIKVSVAVLGPMTLALSRFLIASIMLLAILKIKEPDAKLNRADLPLMAFSGVIGITLYFFFENNGVRLSTASTASIIIATIPVLAVLADFIFCGSRITWPKALGVVLSFLGIYLIFRDRGELSFSSEYFLGNLSMLGAAAAWVAYNLLTRPMAKRYSNLAITTYQTLFGTLAIVPFVFFESNKWASVNWVVAGNVLFLGVFCSAIGYYFYVYAMGEIGVGMASLFINLIPVVTVIASYFIIGEKITPTQLAGGGLVVFAVYLADIGTWFKKGFRVILSGISRDAA